MIRAYPFFRIAFLLVFLWGWFPIQAQLPEEIKEFLYSREFSELLQRYKQEHVSLSSKGRKAEALAARPYHTVRGWRVQVFAGSSLKNAERIASRLRALRLDSVYVVEGPVGLYKVQLGNFETRQAAEEFLNRWRHTELKGAWVTETEIHLSRRRTPAPPDTSAQAVLMPNPPHPPKALYYAIQVFATGDPAKATRIKQALEQKLGEPVLILQRDSLWKVLVGKFRDREAAKKLLERLRRQQFTDAWITQFVSS